MNVGGATAVEFVQVFPVLHFVLGSGAVNPINSEFKTKPVATAVIKPGVEETRCALEMSVVPPCGSETTPEILPNDLNTLVII